MAAAEIRTTGMSQVGGAVEDDFGFDDNLLAEIEDAAMTQQQQQQGEGGNGGLDIYNDENANPDQNEEGEKEVEPKKKREMFHILKDDHLCGDEGLKYVLFQFKHLFKARGKGHERSDLRKLLEVYQDWGKSLFNRLDFQSYIYKVGRLFANKPRVSRQLDMFRHWAAGDTAYKDDMDVDFGNGEEVAGGVGEVARAIQEDEDILRQVDNMMEEVGTQGNFGQMYEPIPPPAQPSQPLTQEQRDRIAANKAAALAKKRAREEAEQIADAGTSTAAPENSGTAEPSAKRLHLPTEEEEAFASLPESQDLVQTQNTATQPDETQEVAQEEGPSDTQMTRNTDDMLNGMDENALALGTNTLERGDTADTLVATANEDDAQPAEAAPEQVADGAPEAAGETPSSEPLATEDYSTAPTQIATVGDSIEPTQIAEVPVDSQDSAPIADDEIQLAPVPSQTQDSLTQNTAPETGSPDA